MVGMALTGSIAVRVTWLDYEGAYLGGSAQPVECGGDWRPAARWLSGLFRPEKVRICSLIGVGPIAVGSYLALFEKVHFLFAAAACAMSRFEESKRTSLLHLIVNRKLFYLLLMYIFNTLFPAERIGIVFAESFVVISHFAVRGPSILR